MVEHNSATEAGPQSRRGLLRLLVPDSYQGRYLMLASLLVLVLLSIAWFGNGYVQEITNAQVARLVNRDSLLARLQQHMQSLQETEAALRRQLPAPHPPLPGWLGNPRFAPGESALTTGGGPLLQPSAREALTEIIRHPERLAPGTETLGPRPAPPLPDSELPERLQGLRAELANLLNELKSQSARDAEETVAMAEQLTRTLLLVTLANILLILGAYIYLRTRILKPISATTQALRQEAAGVTHNQIPIPKLRETRDLVSAFAEMRREVWRRQRGLDYLAHHDPLTQLPNRILFKDRLQHAITMAQRNNQMVALLFLDLDNFKQINDTLGHLAGDELLVTVAQRLKKLLRSSDTVARLGGDEFAILLENVEGKRQTRNTASKILSALSEPVTLSGHEFHLTASIGIAMAPYDDSHPDNLIRDADSAMYEAKRLGKNAYFFFSAELLERATSQLNLERELRAALEKDEFLFHFQPIVHTRSKKIYSVEALIRWQPAKGPLRYPDEFIDTLLNIDNKQEFMEKLLRQIDELQQRCLEELQIQLPVAINLSASVLRNSTQHNLILNSLKRRRYPELLRIEITEDTLLEDLANAHVLLNEIRRLGIPLVLDDFGTGQSSLNHLRSFPFDAIKIDKEFVMNLDKNPEDANLVKAVTQLAHSFNMKVVAEGVESEVHRSYLKEIGCDYLQGYLISKPISSSRLFAMLEHLRSRLKVVN